MSFSTLQRVEIAENRAPAPRTRAGSCVSVLFNESKLLKKPTPGATSLRTDVSVLFNESKLLKLDDAPDGENEARVSVLFNESKLLKSHQASDHLWRQFGFSTLQRVEIAEIGDGSGASKEITRFSTLQRVEIAEIRLGTIDNGRRYGFQYSSTSRNC